MVYHAHTPEEAKQYVSASASANQHWTNTLTIIDS